MQGLTIAILVASVLLISLIFASSFLVAFEPSGSEQVRGGLQSPGVLSAYIIAFILLLGGLAVYFTSVKGQIDRPYLLPMLFGLVLMSFISSQIALMTSLLQVNVVPPSQKRMQPTWLKTLMLAVATLGAILVMTGFGLAAQKYNSTDPDVKPLSISDFVLQSWTLMFVGALAFFAAVFYYFFKIIENDDERLIVLAIYTVFSLMLSVWACWYSSVRIRFAA